MPALGRIQEASVEQSDSDQSQLIQGTWKLQVFGKPTLHEGFQKLGAPFWESLQ